MIEQLFLDSVLQKVCNGFFSGQRAHLCHELWFSQIFCYFAASLCVSCLGLVDFKKRWPNINREQSMFSKTFFYINICVDDYNSSAHMEAEMFHRSSCNYGCRRIQILLHFDNFLWIQQPSNIFAFLNSGSEFLWVGLSVCRSVCWSVGLSTEKIVIYDRAAIE